MNQLPKIELHVHFDGACEVALLRTMCIEDKLDNDRFHYDDLEVFKGVVSLLKPQESLVDFLKPFFDVTYILSSKKNLGMQARDFCRRQSENNVIYTEVRYCPHLLTQRDNLTAEEVVKVISESLKDGQKLYNVKVRSILSLLKTNPEWSIEIADLAVKYKDSGIVGIDIAGDELQPMEERHIKAFQIAHSAGIHATVHAAESGPAGNVQEAIDKLYAKRIGHGYNVLNDTTVYKYAQEKGVHFEVCPTSSCFTNSVHSFETHPVKTFAKDSVNFGLNTDDPGIINTNLNNEFVVTSSKIGLTEEQIITSIYNSAKSCFLPDDEKDQLIKDVDEKIAKLQKQ